MAQVTFSAEAADLSTLQPFRQIPFNNILKLQDVLPIRPDQFLPNVRWKGRFGEVLRADFRRHTSAQATRN